MSGILIKFFKKLILYSLKLIKKLRNFIKKRIRNLTINILRKIKTLLKNLTRNILKKAVNLLKNLVKLIKRQTKSDLENKLFNESLVSSKGTFIFTRCRF